MDVLLDPNVRGYMIGATNVLFKQKKNIADILVEVIESCRSAHLTFRALLSDETFYR